MGITYSFACSLVELGEVLLIDATTETEITKKQLNFVISIPNFVPPCLSYLPAYFTTFSLDKRIPTTRGSEYPDKIERKGEG